MEQENIVLVKIIQNHHLNLWIKEKEVKTSIVNLSLQIITKEKIKKRILKIVVEKKRS
jgi:hypothetical protein